MKRKYGNLTVVVRPGTEAWVPPESWLQAIGANLDAPHGVAFHPRAEREYAWSKDHPSRRAPGERYSWRAYTMGKRTRIFVDATETPESAKWLFLHELAHAKINQLPGIAGVLRRMPRPENYATSDEAHESVPEEQVCNRVADVLAQQMGGTPGLGRLWWRARVRKLSPNNR
jgi:hypothetical protein